MQPVDRNDPRPVYVQIAASIRAAILNGELAPGSRLPTGLELAETFGVNPVTINNAIRELRAEGFVRTRSGSGVYVRDQAAQPVPAGEPHAYAGVANFLHEAGHLKNTPRTGWQLLGMQRPESVAEHSYRVTIVGMALAALEGANVDHTAALSVLHDLHETRIGDIASVGRAYLTAASPAAVTSHQTADTPHEVGKVFQELTAEYEATETPESRCAHDADKLETLLQAREYASQGYNTEAWRKTSIEALRTNSAKELARAIMAGDPADWFQSFQQSYHELRASAKNRARLPTAS